MAKTKTGNVIYWNASSPLLAIFRLGPEKGSGFPEYKAGQYIALRREDCLLTKKVVGADGQTDYQAELDENGNPKRGPVTHSYSIASAPHTTQIDGYLEFYVILEKHERGSGRLTESLFRMRPDDDNKLTYYDIITGTFTLEKRAAGYQNVVMVGPGTGLAPFVSIIKQLNYEAQQGKSNAVRYTLFHTNRTRQELDYYDELATIARARRFDFVYVPSVSRVSEQDRSDPTLGKGRANNVLRHVFAMPLKEEQDLQDVLTAGGDATRAQAVLDRTTLPVLPEETPREFLRQRMHPTQTVLMTCGNAGLMADIKTIADANGIRFEKEDW
ncbi:MAG: hypothetical protein IT331_09935 [Anaerolineae bacterium]|nr:hypothetical protein [Anaerolineae bacterium]